MPIAVPKTVLEFVDAKGANPFRLWLDGLRNIKAKAVIADLIARVRAGNTGDANDVGGGVFELRIDFGPGYRVYFGNDGRIIVILLCGGDKSTQDGDIKTAKANWLSYKARTRK